MTSKDRKNLWGDVLAADESFPPVIILREQASLLGQITKNLLEGRVSVQREGNAFVYDLDIVAPILDHYIYTVLQVKHDVSMYPLTIIDQKDYKTYLCNDESQFIAQLETTLSSPHVAKVIASLLAQSRAISTKIDDTLRPNQNLMKELVA